MEKVFALRLPIYLVKIIDCVFLLLLVLAMGQGTSFAVTVKSEQSDGVGTMNRHLIAEKNREKFLGDMQNSFAKTDPDLAAIRDHLVYGEIVDRGTLTDKQRMLIALVVLATNQTLDEIKSHTKAALRIGIAPVEIKEALYQCVPYIGFPKTESAIRLVNNVFSEKGISLPVESQATVTELSRFKDGLAVQKTIFGSSIDAMHTATPENQTDIMVNYLSAFCFGDFYTRKGLDLRTRELLTFSIVSSLGGCEAQVKAHVQGNANMGNTKENLIDALAQMLPYVGFPRTLNALSCVNTVLKDSLED